jgi:hypothetical protein
MPIYVLHISPQDVVRLVRAETASAGGQPELFVNAWEDYEIEEDFDRHAYGLADGDKYSLVSVEAVLNIEARLEQNYWVLSIAVRKDLGPQAIESDDALLGASLTLDRFETDFLSIGDALVRVRLQTHTARAREHFRQWWSELNRRHPMERAQVPFPGNPTVAVRRCSAC